MRVSRSIHIFNMQNSHEHWGWFVDPEQCLSAPSQVPPWKQMRAGIPFLSSTPEEDEDDEANDEELRDLCIENHWNGHTLLHCLFLCVCAYVAMCVL